MSGDLIINGVDAYTTWGVSMGDNFISILEAPVSVKEYISNESRSEHGKRVITDAGTIKLASRDVTLQFHIVGSSESDYLARRAAFYDVLYAGLVTLQIPSRGDALYKLLYTGKQISFAQTGMEGKLSVKFEEPNPTDRA